MEVVSDTKKNLDENKLKSMKKFFDKNTIPHLAYILERYNKYKTQYFITPYRDIVGKYDIYKQVLIYSIARQESHFTLFYFILFSTRSYANNAIFLSLDISKKLNEEYNIYEQFIPK